MEIVAYEMKYVKDDIEKNNILCIAFERKYFQQYMEIYNACFYEMRKSLENEKAFMLYEKVGFVITNTIGYVKS